MLRSSVFVHLILSGALALAACSEDAPGGGLPDLRVGSTADGGGAGGNDDATSGANDDATAGANDDAAAGANDDAAAGANDDALVGPTDDAATTSTSADAAMGANDDAATGANDDAAMGANDDAATGANDDAATGANDDATVGATDDAGAGAGDGSSAAGDAGAPVRDGGSSTGDGGATSRDASTRDGAVATADGGATNDGGQLGLPLAAFCSGMGAVVDVGGGACAGNIAQQAFRFALCTCDSVQMQSNIQIDAFDSRLGPYGAATPTGPNVLEDGHVGVNGQLSVGGMMDVLGSVFVSGGGFSVGQRSSISLNVYAAGDAVQSNSFTEIGRNMFIDGDVVGRYDIDQNLNVPLLASVDPATLANLGGTLVRGPIPAITPCACSASEILDIQALVDFGAGFNDNRATGVITSTAWASGTGPDVIVLPCGRYYLTRIQHPRGITIRATGRTVLYVDGDVTLGGGLRLEVGTGAEIDLFIAGSLGLQAASRLGDPEHPSAVRTYVGGTAPIVLGASTLFGGNLYAPRADVSFNASADLYGALFARSAFFSGSASVHFDHAIRSAGNACGGDAGVGDGGVGDGGGAVADGGVRDGGGVVADGGVRDAGGVVADGGVRDAGAPAADAGPGCTQCFSCGTQACLIPPDAGSGICGACQSDLDCCPTNLCIGGSCVPSF